MPGDASSADAAPATVHTVNTIFTNAARLDPGTHLAILQSLDRKIGGICFRADQFAESVEDWNGAPVIFAPEHPNLDAYDADPAAELARIGGRVVGAVANARIETAGHPRLMGDLPFGGDPEVEQLCADGKLSHSTAFRTRPITNATITSPPRPHHVLVFEEVPGEAMPKDPGAWILNMTDHTNAGKVISTANAGTLKSAIKALVGLFKDMTGEAEPFFANQEAPVAEPAPADDGPAEPAAAQETPIDMNETEVAEMVQKAVAEKDVALTQKDAEIANLREQLATHEQAAKDATWTAIKNTLPVGWTDTADKEQEIRAMAETRPLEFAQKLATMPRPDPTKTAEQGAEFANKEADESLAITRELRTATGTLR
jgi:hypothetical protein